MGMSLALGVAVCACFLTGCAESYSIPAEEAEPMRTLLAEMDGRIYVAANEIFVIDGGMHGSAYTEEVEEARALAKTFVSDEDGPCDCLAYYTLMLPDGTKYSIHQHDGEDMVRTEKLVYSVRADGSVSYTIKYGHMSAEVLPFITRVLTEEDLRG